MVLEIRAIRRTSVTSELKNSLLRASNDQVERPRYTAIYEALYRSRPLQPLVRRNHRVGRGRPTRRNLSRSSRDKSREMIFIHNKPNGTAAKMAAKMATSRAP